MSFKIYNGGGGGGGLSATDDKRIKLASGGEHTVYMIRTSINNRFYVGRTNNMKRRIKEHRSDWRRGIHGNAHMQRTYNKYGEDAFEILPMVTGLTEQGAIDMEQMLLDKHASNRDCYNMQTNAVGGGRAPGFKVSAETRAKQSKRAKERLAIFHPLAMKVQVEYPDGTVQIFKSQTDAGNKLNISRRQVGDYIAGKATPGRRKASAHLRDCKFTEITQ